MTSNLNSLIQSGITPLFLLLVNRLLVKTRKEIGFNRQGCFKLIHLRRF